MRRRRFEVDTSHILFFLRFVSFSFLSLSLCGKEEQVHAEGSDYRFEWS